MTIRYITSGDGFRAKGLLGEGRHQLSILRNAMKFQGLKQLQRVVKFNDGTIIKCSSCFGQDTVNVFVPPYIPEPVEERKIVEEYEGWEEDWGTTVCENHNWHVDSIWCPNPLPDEFTIEDSIMKCITAPTGTTGIWFNELAWSSTAPEEIRTEGEITTADMMALKISTTLTCEHIDSAIGLNITDTDGNNTNFIFESNQTFLEEDGYYHIDDNNGDEQIITLIDYGLTGYITWLIFWIYVGGNYPAFGQFDLDYIKFSNALEYFQ